MGIVKAIVLLAVCLPVVSHGAEKPKPSEHQPKMSGLAAACAIHNVRDYGATGTRKQSSKETTAAIQKAIDTCAEKGGGMVYVGPGQYVTGPLNLKSNVRFYIEAGATIYGSRDPNDWGRGRGQAILYGEDLVNVTIEGRGTVDGNAEHAQFPYTEKSDNEIQYRIDALKRDKPEGMPFWKWTRPTYNIVYLRNCTDVRITGVTLMNSPVWCVHFLACERVVVDGVYVYSSLIEGVNSDGINPNGCKDVRISNCTIVTGDDCISLKSGGSGRSARVCENITITNCRLTSASSGVKIGDEIDADVRHVVIDNCVIRNSHRAFAFMIIDGGTVSDVIVSNITIECTRHDWFWWGQGDAFYFKIAKRREDSKIGKFENIIIKDVIANVKGTSIINGHPESPLTGIRFENVKFIMSEDPKAYFKEAVHGIEGRYFKDLTLKDVEVVWGEPSSEKWKSALSLEDVDGLTLDGFIGRQAHLDSKEPAVVLKNVTKARIRNCIAAEGTSQFLRIEGEKNKDFRLFGNDFTDAGTAYGPADKADAAITYLTAGEIRK